MIIYYWLYAVPIILLDQAHKVGLKLSDMLSDKQLQLFGTVSHLNVSSLLSQLIGQKLHLAASSIKHIMDAKLNHAQPLPFNQESPGKIPVLPFSGDKIHCIHIIGVDLVVGDINGPHNKCLKY